MTLVTKTVKGIQYLYFQNRVFGGDQIISTYIGRADLQGAQLEQARNAAVLQHWIAVCKAMKVLQTPPYHFQQKPDAPLDNINFLELVRINYRQFKETLTADELREVDEKIFVKYVHGTTAIEGNTFNELETEKLLFGNLTSENKTFGETVEIENYIQVKDFFRTYDGEVTENLIKRVHQLLITGTLDEKGRPQTELGQYRKNNVRIAGALFQPPPPEQIPDEMRRTLREYYDGIGTRVHPLELAAVFHQKFEHIHPFKDGNGRVGREILNYMVTQSDYPPMYVPPKERSMYLKALQEADMNNFGPLVTYIVGRVVMTFDFIGARTRLFTVFSSDDFKNFVTEFFGQEVSNVQSQLLRKLHEDEGLP